VSFAKVASDHATLEGFAPQQYYFPGKMMIEANRKKDQMVAVVADCCN
jgi:hypothetical protein